MEKILPKEHVYCALRIWESEERLNFQKIEKNISLKYTSKGIKGSPSYIKSKKGKEKTGIIKNDFIFYEIRIDNLNEFSKEFTLLLNSITKYKEFLKELSQVNEIELTCSFYSNFSRTGIRISPEILKKISNLELKFTLDYFLFGAPEFSS